MKKIFILFLIVTAFKIHSQCPPNVSASMLTQTLLCSMPTILATGSSTTANTVVSWIVPGNPSVVAQPTVMIGPGTGPPTSTTALAYANYTVVATNTLLVCQSTSVITISQNFKPPVSSPTISVGSPTAVYCAGAVSPVVISTGNSTTTSGGPNAFLSNPCWTGPPPQAANCSVNYSCYVPGVYSLSISDNYNGCTKTGTINVIDKTQPPVITLPMSTITANCGSGSIFNIALTGTISNGVRYLYSQYPLGASFVPSNANNFNNNMALSGTSSYSAILTSPGVYVYVVTNTVTGCFATGTVNVVLNDPVSAVSLASVTLPSCPSCCDGSITISNGGFTSYSVTASSGNVIGTPPSMITNLCSTLVSVCVVNTSNGCNICGYIPTANIETHGTDIDSGFILYPNPTNSSFYIKGTQQKSGTVKVLNIEGKEIEKLIFENDLEIKKLNAGIYFVEIKIENSIIRKKIIVLK